MISAAEIIKPDTKHGKLADDATDKKKDEEEDKPAFLKDKEKKDNAVADKPNTHAASGLPATAEELQTLIANSVGAALMCKADESKKTIKSSRFIIPTFHIVIYRRRYLGAYQL